MKKFFRFVLAGIFIIGGLGCLILGVNVVLRGDLLSVLRGIDLALFGMGLVWSGILVILNEKIDEIIHFLVYMLP